MHQIWIFQKIMDIKALIRQYFDSAEGTPTIDVFDNDTIYAIYQKVIGVLTHNMEIETTMLQALSYCFYEVLDNVLTHSGKILGSVLTHYDAKKQSLRVLVADDGIGIHKSLSQESKYASITEAEALKACIEDSVTDGKGMGFGLYSTSLLVKNIGIQFEIHSGTHKLQLVDNDFIVTDAEPWQGTLVFLEVHTNKEINPNTIVANRTDCVSQYNEEFLDKANIEDLW